MTEPTQAELALTIAKAKCLSTCGTTDDPVLAASLHEDHRAELEAAYKAFQEVGGGSDSNPASGLTQVEARLVVDSGLA